MSKQKWVRTDLTDLSPNITPGKWYKAEHPGLWCADQNLPVNNPDTTFSLTFDNGTRQLGLFKDCFHLNGGSWGVGEFEGDPNDA